MHTRERSELLHYTMNNKTTKVEGKIELEERERESERLAVPVTLEVHEVVLSGNEVDGPAPGDGVD